MAGSALPRGLPTIAENRALRLSMVFLLYVAQGAPIGVFFFAIPGWLAIQGASVAELGLVATATSLPWTLKFVNGFVMDRFTYLPMGRRRAWLIVSQLIMVGGLLVMAGMAPTSDQVMLLAIFSFAIMTATTFQDVAIDGMAVDLIPDDERARANGLMFGGQAIGTAAGTVMTGRLMAEYGIAIAMCGVALFVAVILALLIIFRERPGERLLPWTAGTSSAAAEAIQLSAWWPIIRTVFTVMMRRRTILLAGAMYANGVCYGLYIVGMPLIAVNETGWTETRFTDVSGTGNLVAGLAGVFVLGLLADRIGTRLAAQLQFLAIVLGVVGMLAARQSWDSDTFIQATVLIFLTLTTGISIANCASAMRICDAAVGATQFTIFMAISNFGTTTGNAIYSGVYGAAGYAGILGVCAAVSILAIGLLALLRLPPVQRAAT